MKNLVAIGAAVFLGVIAVFAVWKYVEEQEQALRGQQGMVLVVSKDLDAGEDITPGHLEQRMVTNPAPGALTPEDETQVIGAKAAVGIQAGTTLLASMLKAVDRHFAKEMIEPGRRAVTLQVDQDSGFSGMLVPGDVIDILITYDPATSLEAQLSAAGGPETPDPNAPKTPAGTVTTFMLSGVTIVALDNRTTRGVYNAEDIDYKAKDYSMITISVTPQEAQLITFAQQSVGVKMTFLLRNPEDKVAPKVDDLDAEYFPVLLKNLQAQRNK